MNRPRKWELPALDPTDPSGASTRTVWIDQRTIELLTRGMLIHKFYRIQCAKDVLTAPDMIVEGWNREGYDDGLCYIGRPADRPNDGIELPSRPKMCFLAIVLPNGKMEEWRWEEFALNRDDDCRKQFGENWRRVWPPIGMR